MRRTWVLAVPLATVVCAVAGCVTTDPSTPTRAPVTSTTTTPTASPDDVTVITPTTVPTPPTPPTTTPSGPVESVVIADASFEFGRASLTDQARLDLVDELEAVVRSGRPILVVGHTDNAGTVAFNLALSRRRAEEVADLLEALGVDPARVRVEGRGESEPISDDPAANRRVEVIS